MAQEPTLLAHLVPRLTSQVEDAATDALAFILNRSAACREALDRFIWDGDLGPEPITRVETQVTYEDGSRPDMVGYDQGGSKRLLVESKFWATLLQGQASGYFRQLEEDGPAVLMFIAPASRIETLWAEIKRRMETGEDKVKLEEVKAPRGARRAWVEGTDKQLVLTSWARLLNSLATAAAGDSEVVSDIRQLRGLAKHQDERAFLPIHPEEVGLALPRRILGLNRLIDAVVERGVRQKWITVQGLRATPQRDGYGRYIRFTGVPGSLFLSVSFGLWANSGDTPLWLRIAPELPVDRAVILNRVPRPTEPTDWPKYDVPIHLKTGAEYEDVLDDVTLLCLSNWFWWGVFEESVDLSGDVAFEEAAGFAGGFSFVDAFLDVGAGFGAVPAAGDGDGVDCLVELAVAASVESVAGVLSGGGFEGCHAG